MRRYKPSIMFLHTIKIKITYRKILISQKNIDTQKSARREYIENKFWALLTKFTCSSY